MIDSNWKILIINSIILFHRCHPSDRRALWDRMCTMIARSKGISFRKWMSATHCSLLILLLYLSGKDLYLKFSSTLNLRLSQFWCKSSSLLSFIGNKIQWKFFLGRVCVNVLWYPNLLVDNLFLCTCKRQLKTVQYLVTS